MLFSIYVFYFVRCLVRSLEIGCLFSVQLAARALLCLYECLLKRAFLRRFLSRLICFFNLNKPAIPYSDAGQFISVWFYCGFQNAPPTELLNSKHWNVKRWRLPFSWRKNFLADQQPSQNGGCGTQPSRRKSSIPHEIRRLCCHIYRYHALCS